MTDKDKDVGGRPSKYKEEYDEQAYKLCLLGATDKELGDFFEVAESTINLWKLEHEGFSESIKRGKSLADAIVAEKLFHRATGYEHEEQKVFLYEGQPVIVDTVKHYPPDTTAGIFWLKNRQPNLWRDKQVIDHSSEDGSMSPKASIDLSELSDAELRALNAIAKRHQESSS